MSNKTEKPMSKTTEEAARAQRTLGIVFMEVDHLLQDATAASCENTPEGTEEVRQLDECVDHLFEAARILSRISGEPFEPF